MVRRGVVYTTYYLGWITFKGQSELPRLASFAGPGYGVQGDVEGCQFKVGCLVGFGGFANYSAIM